MGDKEKCYPWPLCYYAWIQVINSNYFFVFLEFIFLFVGKSVQDVGGLLGLREERRRKNRRRRRRRLFYGLALLRKRGSDEIAIEIKKSPSSRNFPNRKRREIAVICPTFFSPVRENDVRGITPKKKNPPLSTAAKLARQAFASLGNRGVRSRTWSKNRVSPRSPPLYLLIKWIGWRRKNAEHSFIQKPSALFFLFFFASIFVPNRSRSFPSFRAFFIARYLSAKKQGKEKLWVARIALLVWNMTFLVLPLWGIICGQKWWNIHLQNLGKQSTFMKQNF